MRSIGSVIDGFAGLRVLVIGDAMLDVYLYGRAIRRCREATAPLVDIEQRQETGGGAANTALNIASLGATAVLGSVVGDDLEGSALRQALEAGGVATDQLVLEPGRRTLAKQRVFAHKQCVVRFDQGSTNVISAVREDALCDRITTLWNSCDAVIVSDYGYGVVTPTLINLLQRLQARSPRVLAVDSKNLAAYQHVGVTVATPNYEEAVHVLGHDEMEAQAARRAWLCERGDELLGVTGARMVVVTMDAEGALLFEPGNAPRFVASCPVVYAHSTGAGDTFVSALTLALALGADARSAMHLASIAAAIVVAKAGTATCFHDELRAYISVENRMTYDTRHVLSDQRPSCCPFVEHEAYQQL